MKELLVNLFSLILLVSAEALIKSAVKAKFMVNNRLPLKLNTLLLLMVFLAFGCAEEYNFSTGDNTPLIVIDGQITTQEGPYTVKITQSREFSTRDGSGFVPIKNALVIISDDVGNSETLFPVGERLDLVYKTSLGGIRGEVGKSYTLTVTIDGEIYQSTPQKIEKSGRIFDIRGEYQTEGDPKLGDYFDVLIDIADDSDKRKYYRWDWVGTYEFHAQPERFCEVRCCAGEGEGCVGAAPSCCRVCWINVFSDEISILDSNTTNGINGYSITKVDVINTTFFVRYHLKVNQYSISKEAYDFWNLVKSQT